jgi:hypothetical protein
MSSTAVTLPSQPISFALEEAASTAELVTQEIGGNVTMSRALAESAHGLTLNESRVMMLAMRCINPRHSPYQYAKPTEYVKVRVTAAEFGKLANLLPDAKGYTNRAAYDGLKAACDKLYERSVTWKDGKKVKKSRWVFASVYHADEAWAEISFAPTITPHLFMLNERFVRYRLEYARGLRSIYSTGLLRLLMTQKDTGFKTITLEDFRLAMDVPENYRYGDIKRYCITAAVKELNDKADIHIEWSETKKSRAVTSLQFHFTFVKTDGTRQAQLNLE